MKTLSINKAWESLKIEYGVDRPCIKERIKRGESLEIGDFNHEVQAYPVWVHVVGAAYPEKYWCSI